MEKGTGVVWATVLVVALLGVRSCERGAGTQASGFNGDNGGESSRSSWSWSGWGGRDDEPGSVDKRSGSTVVAQECRRGDGRRIQQLSDWSIRGISDPGTSADAATVGSAQVEGFNVAAVNVPDVTVDGGCVIRYDAPAGCIGAVEITSVTIPAAALPGYSFRRGSGATVSAPGMSAEGTVLAGQRAEQVCPPANNPNAVIFRGSVHRPSGYRPALFRPGTKAGQVCNGDTCVATPAVPSLMLQALTVPEVTVEAETNAEQAVASPAATAVVYVGSADVFFDVDRDTIRPSAEMTLRDISERIRRTKDNVRVTVEGHTDDTGSDQYNLDLSQRRTDAVADWLRREGRLGDRRIDTKGYGETRPAVPNTSDANRQANRRVVISTD